MATTMSAAERVAGMKCVYLEWTDSASMRGGGEWTPHDEIKSMIPMTIKTIGWVARETEDFIIVVNQDSGVSYAGDICIPKPMITKRRAVKL